MSQLTNHNNIVAGHLTWGSVITVAWGRGGGGNGGTPSPGAIERRFKLLRTIHYSSVRQATATGKGPTRGRDNISDRYLQNPVGAGRYDIQKYEEAQHRNGHSSVFKSKSDRPNGAREKFLK